MARSGLIVKAPVLLGLALHFHHHFRGPPISYAGLAAAAAASWVGVPGPGEPVLIAAGIFAAHQKLDLLTVLVVAWAGAAVGGVAGWLIGMKAGRKVLSTRGPLQDMRRSALARGDEIFNRFAVLAILLTPSWIAGIHRVRARLFLPVNAFGAALWTVGIGLGAYYAGPLIVEFVSDLGVVTAVAVAVLVAAIVGGELLRRRRRRAGRTRAATGER